MSGASLAEIVRALGGDLRAGGLRANVPGPGHGPADRSVSLWLQGDRLLIHSFAGDDWRRVRDDLRARRLIDADGRVARSEGAVHDRETLSPGARRRRAQALWREGCDLRGSLSERHLARRGVRTPSEGLRHHPQVPAAIYADRGPRCPALLAAIREPVAGEIVGLEVTYLAVDGGRARVALPRKTVGLIPAGAAVRLAPVAARLLVGEGVFTTLSAAAAFGLPGWALLSAGNLGAWRPPAGARFVLVAGDRGRVGEAAADRLAIALRASGARCEVRFPPAPFGDWNEAASFGREEDSWRP